MALVAVVFAFASCNKLSKQTVYNTNGQQPPVTPDSVVLKSGVIVIDSTQWLLASTASQISQGTYTYFGNNLPNFIVNDIIVGMTGEGYLRKVTSVASQAGQVTLGTIPAKLEDVFLQANINFGTALSNTYDISNTTLFQDGIASVKTTSGTISINPNWNFNMQFQNGGMTEFSAICQNGTLNANVQMNVSSSSAENVNSSVVLNPVPSRTIIWIGQLPIVVTTYLSYVANVTGNVTSLTNGTAAFNTSDNFTIGDVYSEGAWLGTYNFSHTAALTNSVPPLAGFNLSCSIAPQMVQKIYGVVCPTATFSMNTLESTTDGFTEQQSFNVSGNILGYGIPDNNLTWNTDTVSLQATTTNLKLVKTSGDGQVGAPFEYLGAPLVVQVTDNSGVGQAGITVYFTVTSGGGTVSHYSVSTNASGFAQTNWLLGDPATSAQKVQVVGRTATGSQISGSPVTFTAL